MCMVMTVSRQGLKVEVSVRVGKLEQLVACVVM